MWEDSVPEVEAPMVEGATTEVVEVDINQIPTTVITAVNPK